MNKKNKGFTLIELLAVIVILAIIALIATPLVLNVINDTNLGSFKSSTYGIIKATEQGYSQTILKNNNVEMTIYKYENGIANRLVGNIEIKYKGANPKYGNVVLNTYGEISLAIHNGEWCIQKNM